MRNGRPYLEATLTVGLLLSLGPACGRNEMSSKPDASPDRPADRPPVADTLPPAPDLRPAEDLRAAEDPPPRADRPPDLPPSDPVADPPRPSDPRSTDLLLGDRPSDPVVLPDLPIDRPREVGPDGRDDPDLPRDLPPVIDLQKLDQPPAYDQGFVPDEIVRRDSYVTGDGPSPSELCTSTGGTAGTQTCCSSTGNFRDMCSTATGACGCSPANSIAVQVCLCPQPSCFLPGYGCVGPGSTCTVGMDQTCNDNPIISSVRGRCVENGRCVCTTGMSTTSGKCL